MTRPSFRVVALVVSLAGMATATARGAAHMAAPGEISLSGQVGGVSWAVDVVGDRAYAGVGPRLVILDVGDPNEPELLGQSTILPNLPDDINVRNGLAYVTTRSGLHVFRVDADSPVWLADVRLTYPVTDLAFLGEDSVAVGLAGLGLAIYDLSDPNTPIRRGILQMEDVGHVIVDGDTAYVSAGLGGVRVVDVSNPAAPRLLESVDTPGQAGPLALLGGLLAVGDVHVISGANDSLILMDISGSPPVIVSRTELLDTPWSLAAHGTTVYVANWAAGLVAIDVSDAAEPQLGPLTITPGLVRRLALGDGFALVADDLDGLHVFDLSEPLQPRLLPWRGLLRYVNDVVVRGERAFVAEGARFGGGVRMLDLADINRPIEVAHVDTTGDPTEVPGPIDRLALKGNHLYGVGYGRDGLHVFEVGDPDTLQPVGYLPLDFARSLAVSGNFAYIARQYDLTIVNIADPARPRLVGAIEVPGAYSVAVDGDVAFVSTGQAVHLIDVTVPESPAEMSSIQTLPTDVAVQGDRLYVAEQARGIAIYDISNAVEPTLLGGLGFEALRTPTGVTIDGETAYVALGQAGVAVVDVSNPTQPTVTFQTDILEYCQSSAVASGSLLVACGRGGLGVFTLEAEAPTPTPRAPIRSFIPLAVRRSAPIPGHMPSPVPVNLVDSNHAHDFALDAASEEMWTATYGGVVAWSIRGDGYRKFTADDGLLDNIVNTVAVDSDGDRWFGTPLGLSRFSSDGRWTSYTTADGLPANEVVDIAVDGQGTRWFLTPAGAVSLARGATWSARTTHDSAEWQGAVAITFEPATGATWLAYGSNRDGVAQRDVDGNWRHFGVADGLTMPGIVTFEVDGHGRRWFAGRQRHASDSQHLVDAGLFALLEDGTWQSEQAQDGVLSADLPSDSGPVTWTASYFQALTAPAIANAGPLEMVWLGDVCGVGTTPGMATAKLAVVRQGDCSDSAMLAQVSTADPAAAVVIAGDAQLDALISRARPHRIWTHTPVTFPVAMIDAVSGAVLADALLGGVVVSAGPTAEQGLMDDLVQDIAIDGAGNPWFATVGGVATVDDSGTWTVVADDPGLMDTWTWAVAFDHRGALWVGTDDGIRRRAADGTWTSLTTADEVPYNAIRDIAFAEDGTGWIGTWAGGASRLNADKSWTVFRRGPGLVWKERPDHFLGDGFVRALEPDRARGRWWIGTDRGAVAFEDTGVWTRYDTSHGLADNWIEDIHVAADRSTWFATNRGVTRLDNAGQFRTFTQADGLIDTFVRSIAEDEQGNLWFGTASGVARLSSNGEWSRIGSDDGLLGTDVRAVVVAADGTLWFGSNMGLSWLTTSGQLSSFGTPHGVDTLAVDPQRGGIWVGSRGGAELVDQSGVLRHLGRSDGLLDDWIDVLAVDRDGRVWAGTKGRGVSVLP